MHSETISQSRWWTHPSTSKILLYPFIIPPSPGKEWPAFCHCRLVSRIDINDIIQYILFCLAPFTHCNYSEIHPCYCLYQVHSFLLLSNITLLNILQNVYPFTHINKHIGYFQFGAIIKLSWIPMYKPCARMLSFTLGKF